MDIQKMTKIFKALSNPNRLELYLKIAEVRVSSYHDYSECFVSDIMQSFNIGAPTISHHIKELVNAGLITTEKKGKFLICKVNEELVGEVTKLFNL
jgi:ArsR family transcriptional regulator, arsenate/arsenite/antimonite-responsive transcriptional repressor